MRNNIITKLSLIVAISLLAINATAKSPEQSRAKKNLKSGEDVYKEICAACHENGVAHAPKFSDETAWAPLIAEGQDVLTGHAWVGVRAMPPKGGKEDLSLVEFSRGVAYMARNSGGNWQDPDNILFNKIIKQAEKRLDKAILSMKKMKVDLYHQLKHIK